MRGFWAVYAPLPALETPTVLSEIPELSLLGSERKNTLFPVGQIVITFAEWVDLLGNSFIHFS